ncbi:MFS transporter [Bacillus sp. AGMB 02131]|uniref:MFS transporter n=2 Tax=Peribacillus faecalis TaxID=2772559 RepID=A0A927CXD1_9BACI|nr:MFS transporter [Peribacillus faecalis]
MNSAAIIQTAVTSAEPRHKELFGFGIGGIGLYGAWTLVGTFLAFYYTDLVGISAAVVGTLMLIVRFMDGVADIGMGVVVDRTNTKHGKARPWIRWMALPYAVSTVLLFTVPDLGTSGKILYMYVTFIAFNLIFTAVSIPYVTLLGRITQDSYKRSLANIYLGFFNLFATLLVVTVATPLANAFGWLSVSAIFAILSFISLYTTFQSTKERIPVTTSSEKTVLFKTGLKALFVNKYLLIITIVCVLFNMLTTLILSAGVYYASYILNNANLYSIIAFSTIAPMFLGFIFLAPLVKRFGKRNVCAVGSVVLMIGQFIKIMNPDYLIYFLIGTVLAGLGIMPLLSLLKAMINDTIEYGEWRSGVRTEGLINSGASFGMKVGNGLGLALIGWLLAFGGYIGGISEQVALADRMIIWLNVHIPIIIAVIQVIVLWFFKLDSKYRQIVQDLRERKN